MSGIGMLPSQEREEIRLFDEWWAKKARSSRGIAFFGDVPNCGDTVVWIRAQTEEDQELARLAAHAAWMERAKMAYE